MKYIVAVITLLLLLTSCGKKTQLKSRFPAEITSSQSYEKIDSSLVIIDGNQLQVIAYEDIDSILEDIEYIPLKSEEPIGMITHLMVYRERIYILDAYRNESIYIFDLSGKLIKIISSKGGGPQEYIGLGDMCISRKTNELVVSDRLSLHMLHYTLDGDFIKKTKAIPHSYVEMMGDFSVNVLAYGQSFSNDVNYHVITALEDSVVRKGFIFEPLQKQAVNSRPLSCNYRNELLFKPVLSDTIYQIMNDSSYAVKYVVSRKNSIWSKKGEALRTEEYRNLIKESGYTMLGGPVLETQNHVSFPIGEGKEGHTVQKACWYDKRKEMSFTLGIRIDQSSAISSWVPAPIALSGNSFVGFWDAEQIDGLKQYLAYKDNCELLQDEKLKAILAEENAENLECILAIYDFK